MALLVTDPVCFRRDENGDLKFPLELASGLEAVSIGIRARLALFAGEVFSDLDAGTPWIANDAVDERAAILGGASFDATKAHAAVRRSIMRAPGVLTVPELQLSFDADDRALSITFVARTVWGDTPRDTLELEL